MKTTGGGAGLGMMTAGRSGDGNEFRNMCGVGTGLEMIAVGTGRGWI